MLVLGRKAGESIVISDTITVKIISIEGEQVKLGVDAPRHVEIHRQEIYETIQKENKLAGAHQLPIPLEQLSKIAPMNIKCDKGMKIEKKNEKFCSSTKKNEHHSDT